MKYYTERYLGVKFRETAEAISTLDSPEVRALAELATSPITSSGHEPANLSASVN